MIQALVDNFPIITSAPEGVRKLRDLILQLAVRGKLVSQDPNDEPASKLLEGRSLSSGEQRNSLKKSRVKYEEAHSRRLPTGWCWITIEEIAEIRGGSTPSMTNDDYWGGDIPWVSPKDMHCGEIVSTELKITPKALSEWRIDLVPCGSVLLVGRSGILKRKLPVQLTAVPCTINQDLKALTLSIPTNPHFVRILLLGNEQRILSEDVKQGTTVQSLVYDKLFSRKFGLPPLAEQTRIVAKVAELMALCDRLDKHQSDAEESHNILAKALLNALVEGRPEIDVAEAWELVNSNFDVLLTTEFSAETLKETILQLGMMGKLVRQEQSDEPASELLAEVARGKEQLGLRATKGVSPLLGSDVPYTLPQSWEWVRYGELANEIATGPFGSILHQSDYRLGGVPVINPSHMVDGEIVPDEKVAVGKTKAEELSSYRLLEGDIIMARRGEVGRAAIVRKASEGWLCGTGSFIVRFHPKINRSYLLLYLESSYARAFLTAASIGTTMTNLNHGILKSLPVPVAPLAEQERIVKRIVELMKLCDDLKASIVETRAKQTEASKALIDQALVYSESVGENLEPVLVAR